MKPFQPFKGSKRSRHQKPSAAQGVEEIATAGFREATGQQHFVLVEP
jgi:hypothetical protein